MYGKDGWLLRCHCEIVPIVVLLTLNIIFCKLKLLGSFVLVNVVNVVPAHIR